MALHFKVEYNATAPFWHAEGHHLLAFPCMREEYYLRKDNLGSPLQSCARVASLQRGRASQDQARKGTEPHTPLCRNQLVVLTVFSFALASCIPNVQIVNESASGGTIIYSYVEEQDVLTSPGRQDALRLLGEKCPAGYRISREGEVPRIDQAVDRAWMGQISRDGQVSREKSWAIQFSCK